jgi:hypothetical protein
MTHSDLMSKLEPYRYQGRLSAVAWPGAYPLAYLSQRGETLCAHCATEELTDHEAWAKGYQAETGEDPDVTWEDLPETPYVNWEDPHLYCAGCSERIVSAYAEPD